MVVSAPAPLPFRAAQSVDSPIGCVQPVRPCSKPPFCKNWTAAKLVAGAEDDDM
jgi:hypothetical protein